MAKQQEIVLDLFSGTLFKLITLWWWVFRIMDVFLTKRRSWTTFSLFVPPFLAWSITMKRSFQALTFFMQHLAKLFGMEMNIIDINILVSFVILYRGQNYCSAALEKILGEKFNFSWQSFMKTELMNGLALSLARTTTASLSFGSNAKVL